MEKNKQVTGSETDNLDSDAAEIVQISITLPQQLLRGIDALARRRNISRSALFRSVLSQAIEVA